MKNPFEYGGVVGANAFCNRLKELHDLARVFENGEKIFLYAERRMGKTSLIKKALAAVSRTEYMPIYVDLWPTLSEEDLAIRLAKALAESTTTVASKMIGYGKEFFASLRPAVTVDEEGRPQVVFGVQRNQSSTPILDEVLAAIPKIANKLKKKMIIVLDEFQQIAEYGADTVEKRLRSEIQHHEGIAYVFAGSKKHLLDEMFLDKHRPLYRSAAHYPLGPIAENEWQLFIATRFADTDKVIGTDTIQKLCQFTSGHPFYTQHLCHALWEITDVGERASESGLNQALDLVLEREDSAFSALWESLATNQKILLNALAMDGANLHPFGTEFVRNSGLKSASNVQRAAEALLKRDVIDKGKNGAYVIPDKFFKLWLQRRM